VTVTWPWPAATATITDVFGQAQTRQGRDGQIELPVSVTPVFVTGRHPASASRNGTTPRPVAGQ
jgi:hypothetical protein